MKINQYLVKVWQKHRELFLGHSVFDRATGVRFYVGVA